MTSYSHINTKYHTDPDILEVIFMDSGRKAVDEYAQVVLEYAQYLRDNNKLNQSVYIILDITQSGMYPINYGIKKLSEMLDHISDLPKTYGIYITDDSNDRYMIEQLGHFDSTRKQDSRRIFGSNERENGIEWLLSHKNDE